MNLVPRSIRISNPRLDPLRVWIEPVGDFFEIPKGVSVEISYSEEVTPGVDAQPLELSAESDRLVVWGIITKAVRVERGRLGEILWSRA